MTFDEAINLYGCAPFDQEYLWLDAYPKYGSDVRGILFVIVDGSGVCLCQLWDVGPDVDADEVQAHLRRNPWCVCVLDAPAYVEPDRAWHIGTVQDVIHYIRQRALQ